MYDTSSKPNLQSPLILFATPPPLDQLRAITVRLSINMQSMARFQPQVIKCREFIFTEPEIIGTPSADINEHYFHLVAQVSLMNSGKLQARLARIGLQASKPFPVSTELYESCLRYTMLARLSPTWNKAGPWLIQGRDFLTHKGCANAVKMDVNVHHNELFFTLEAAVFKLAPLQVTDLDIIGRHLDEFLKDPAAQLDHSSIASDWCFILPSMKRGRIVRISHDLPEDSPFMTYRDLKRHWKNTYGYRLPDNEDDLNFYQINFGRLGGKLFTYPEVCLRGRDLQKVSRVDPKPILRAFMLELQSKFPTVCGCTLKLQSKAKFPVADLLSSGQQAVRSQPNLTNKMNSSRPALYRTKEEMEKIIAAKQAVQAPNSNRSAPNFRSGFTADQRKAKITTNVGSEACPLISKDDLKESEKTEGNGAKKLNSGLRNLPDCHVNSLQSDTRSAPQEQISQQKTVKNNSINNQTDPQRSRPSLANVGSSNTLVAKTSCIETNKGRYRTGSADTPIQSSKVSNQLQIPGKHVPLFKPKKLLPQMEVEPQPTGQKIIPIFHPQKKNPVSSTVPKPKSVSSVNKPFIAHTSTQASRNDVVKPSFHVSDVKTTYQKSVPSFSLATLNKSVSTFRKLGTSQSTNVASKKEQQKGKPGKEKKEQKDKKPTKRPKTSKKDNQLEIKKAKIMRPEA